MKFHLQKIKRTMRFLKYFIFIVLSVPLVHALDFNCPNSHCGITHYTYPFKLENQEPHVCSHYINLTCTSQNKTILHLPFSGDFHVVSVLYSERTITLSDPKNCLAKRLMSLNLTSSPFAAEYYQTFTFYNCPIYREIYGNDFTLIDCLSIPPNVTLASSYLSSAEMMKFYGCSKIVTKEIPAVAIWFEKDYDFFNNLKLKWNVPSCRDCDQDPFASHNQGESKKNTSTIIAIVILIPLVIIVAFVVALSKGVANQRRRATATPTTTREAALPRQTTTTPAAVMQPQLVSVEDIIVPDGQFSYLKTMVFSTFLERNSGSSEGEAQGTSCTICLEEYRPQDIIRSLNSCHHYFHSRCIDMWVRDNSSCPVCRISIYNV